MSSSSYPREPLSTKDFHILYALALRPLHGYALVQDVEDRTDGAVRLEPANLYRRLHGFVEDGLIEQTEPPEDEAGEDSRRKYYRVTERGRQTVRSEVRRMGRWVEDARARGLVGEGSGG